jgi:hypothetical protein
MVKGVVVIVVQHDVPSSGHRLVQRNLFIDQRIFFDFRHPDVLHVVKINRHTGRAS